MLTAAPVLRAATLGRDPQSFLDAAWVTRLLTMAPARWQRRLALSIVSWSPHYFYRRPDNAGMSRLAFLETECSRNRESRITLGRRLLKPYLSASDVVLDYGCGPGFFSNYVARHARTVFAVDISRGVLGCARVLNGTPNTTFLHTSELVALPDAVVDVAYSFAVFQHVTDAVLGRALATIRRVLRPGGWLIAHVVIDAPGWRSEADWRRDRSLRGRLKLRYGLNCFSRTEAHIRELLDVAGFRSVQVQALQTVFPTPIDDICTQHLVTARR